MSEITAILNKTDLTREDLVCLLQAENEDRLALFEKAASVREKNVGNSVYLRGLIELSNICSKNCMYCGIRRDNKKIHRYDLEDDQVLEAAEYAYTNGYGSLVLQSGELSNQKFTDRIEKLLRQIKQQSKGELGITLSLGEQSFETYKKWSDAGAHRYLLRIETSNKEFYRKLHPNDANHDYDRRLQCLKDLKEIGYQVGTGVMIGLPFQTYELLADDLMFMKELDIDMVGMGPYIEHEDTPLFQYRDTLLPPEKRLDLSLKMIAILRILMKDINMAATTAMQAIDKIGRGKAIKAGANVVMPNITPGDFRDDYALYQNKPCTSENADDCKSCLEARIHITGYDIGYNQWGDSRHFHKRIK